MTRSTHFTLVLLAVLALAVIGFAQNPPVVYSNDAFVDAQVTTNQCSSAGEPVTLNGKLHADMTFTTDSNGVNHFSIAVSSDLNGTGLNSGLPYSAKDSNSYIINSGDEAGEITVEFRSDLTPVSGGPAMTLIQTLHLTANVNGTVAIEVQDNSTQCGS